MADDEDAVDEVADRLYELDPEDFVGARDKAAKEIRARGDTAGAKAVKALRRPTVAAWAVNRFVRVHHEELAEFLDLTTELSDAQQKAMAGGKADLRGLSERRQRMMDQLVKQTLAIIEAAGRSSTADEDDIVRTFQASNDPDLANQLRDGRLVNVLRPGFDARRVCPLGPTNSSNRSPRRSASNAPSWNGPSALAQDELADADSEVRAAQAEVDRLQEELRQAERDAQQALRRQEQRRAALEKAREALDE